MCGLHVAVCSPPGGPNACMLVGTKIRRCIDVLGSLECLCLDRDFECLSHSKALNACHIARL